MGAYCITVSIATDIVGTVSISLIEADIIILDTVVIESTCVWVCLFGEKKS